MTPPYDDEDEGGADLALVFGPAKKKGKKKDDADDEMPAEYESAYSEWEDDPGPETMWRMIKACVEGGY